MFDPTNQLQGLRPDYLKFRIYGLVPRVVAEKNALLSEHASYCEDYGFACKSRCWSMPGDETGQVALFVEFWGPACLFVHRLDWDTWAPRLHRFDARKEHGIAREVDITHLHGLLIQNPLVKSIGLQRTAARQRKNGRDPGGLLLSIGSHKSQLRTTFYKRKGELAAVESQATGPLLLRKVMEASVDTLGEESGEYTRWDALAELIWDRGMERVQRLSQLHTDGVFHVLSGTRVEFDT